MDTRLTAEQEEIRRTLRELLVKRCGPQELRAAEPTPPATTRRSGRPSRTGSGCPDSPFPRRTAVSAAR